MSEPQNPQSKEGPHALPAALLHDLRTPLNQILGYSALLMEQAQEQGQDGFVSDLQKTQRAGRQLLTLIDDNFHSGSVRTTSPQLAPQSAIEPGAGESGEDPVPGERLSDGARGLILVVDDIEANRDVLSRRLKRQGHTVTTAENGSQALQSLRESVFDLVLLDIMMPEMDGYEVLRRLKADPALGHIPVIMISALNELDSVVRCIELGAEDYLPKPFNPILLKARIGACLEKKRSRDRETQDHRRMQELAGALALQNSEMTRWRKALEADLAVARRTQQALILSVPPLAEGWQVEVVYKPLIQVGGDAYGWRQLDNEVWLFWLADATGHGVAAALLTTLIASLFKRASDSTISAHGILARVNEEFHKILDGSSFMTACCAVDSKKMTV